MEALDFILYSEEVIMGKDSPSVYVVRLSSNHFSCCISISVCTFVSWYKVILYVCYPFTLYASLASLSLVSLCMNALMSREVCSNFWYVLLVGGSYSVTEFCIETGVQYGIFKHVRRLW